MFGISTNSACLLVVLLVLLLFSSFFSSARATLVSIGGVGLHSLTSNKGGQTTLTLSVARGRATGVLDTVLVNGGVIGISTSSLTAALTCSFNKCVIDVTALVLAITVLMFKRVAPGGCTAVGTRGLALHCVPIVGFFVAIVAPIVFVVGLFSHKVVLVLHMSPSTTGGTVARRRLHAVISIDRRSNMVRSSRGRVVCGMFSLNSTGTGSVVIPHMRIAFTSIGDAFSRLVSVFHRSGFAELPICRRARSGIINVVGVGSLLLCSRSAPFGVQSFLEGPRFACRFGSVSRLLMRVESSAFGVTVILSRCNRVTKLVALRSVLRRVINRVRSRCSRGRSRLVGRVSSRRCVVRNSVDLSSIGSRLRARLSSRSCSSLKKLVVRRLSHLPRVNSRIIARSKVHLIIRGLSGGHMRAMRICLPREASARRTSKRASSSSRASGRSRR